MLRLFMLGLILLLFVMVVRLLVLEEELSTYHWSTWLGGGLAAALVILNNGYQPRLRPMTREPRP
jgi:uncharacterized membrane protein YdcZ (DUF606 family)